MIVSSTFTPGPVAPDGRWNVDETHTNDDGRVFPYSYLCTTIMDMQAIMEERAIVINVTLAAREAARLMVVGTEVPYTKHEFLSRFTPDERIAIRNFAKSVHPVAEYVTDFMEMLNASGGVYMTLARPGIALLKTYNVGNITAERAAELSVD
ncbi:MAG: hypothetical protein U1A73_27265 [Pseudomonas sp.]|nr:hypothetical protein [Pseudomonas sp.]